MPRPVAGSIGCGDVITGRRSGSARITPLTYHRDGDRLVMMASAGGNPTDPAWYRNIVADPAVVVEVGADRYDAAASTAGDERTRLYEAMVAALPRFGDYQDAVDRTIPLVVLTPR
jgi:deazaflavin-dependent oxidoreductase (nitroreductase family)